MDEQAGKVRDAQLCKRSKAGAASIGMEAGQKVGQLPPFAESAKDGIPRSGLQSYCAISNTVPHPWTAAPAQFPAPPCEVVP